MKTAICKTVNNELMLYDNDYFISIVKSQSTMIHLSNKVVNYVLNENNRAIILSINK